MNIIEFKAPAEINLKELATSTTIAVRLLVPWCGPEHQGNTVLKKLTDQARRYARAIDFSVNAAQKGYSIATDALHLAQSMKSSPTRDSDKFAAGMIDSAQKAHKIAKKSLVTFRNVRVELMKIVKEVEESLSTDQITVGGELKKLKDGIPVFDKLAQNISMFVSWWNWAELTTNAHEENQQNVVMKNANLKVRYSSLRDKAVVAKWRELQDSFLQYKQKISELQDSLPDTFDHLDGTENDVFDDTDTLDGTQHKPLPGEQHKPGVWGVIKSLWKK